MPIKKNRSLEALRRKEEKLTNNALLHIRLTPALLERLQAIPDRSAFIRNAIERKLINCPKYEKRPQQNGGKYLQVRVPEVLMIALESVPVRDRSEFVRQAVEEKLAVEES